MDRTFTSANDAALIELIRGAKQRLAVIGPGLTTPVAQALTLRMEDLPQLELTIILDADPEVYRMGYGDVEALALIRKASAAAHFDLRVQSGVRIGVVISDDRTMIYAPVSRNVVAGSTSPEHPNAIVLGSAATATLASASGAIRNDAPDARPQEIGTEALTPEKADAVEKNLKENPPQPVDLTRKLRVFRSEVQFAEITLTNALFSSRTIKLPPDFQKIADSALRDGIKASLKIPIDPKQTLVVSIGDKKRVISEADLKRERAELAKSFLYDWKGRGKVILRKDKDLFQAKLDELRALTEAFQTAMKNELKGHRDKFCDQMVKEFLDHWKASPPARLRNREKAEEPHLTADIKLQAERMFDIAIEMGAPEAKVIYKDIALEDLKDQDLMAKLKKLMLDAGVDEATVGKLFETGNAVAVGKAQ